MVTIQHIKTTKCPVCGCDTIVEEHVETEIGSTKIRRHTNGGVWEHRKFACGLRIDYIPNFEEEHVARKCTQDPEVLAENAMKLAAKSAVLDFIVGLDCSEYYKQVLSNAISNL